MVSALAIIPARYASTRFPGKPLASLGDSTLIERVWRAVRTAGSIERVIVATDDPRIAEHCRGFGAETAMTDPGHPSGTDRAAEVVRSLETDPSIVVNVQGDEPFVTGTSLDRLVAAVTTPGTPLATLVEPMPSLDELDDPGVVKVAATADGRALYFSRSPIPHFRGDRGEPGFLANYKKHQGIYAFRREVLLRLTQLPPSPLERAEGLEQLRALENGIPIRVLESDFRSVGVDTPADLERATALLGETCR